LFEHAEKRDLKTIKFQAAIHGIDLDKDKKSKGEKLMFPHPDTFKNMSKEERKKKTDLQLRIHKSMLQKQLRMG